MKKKLLSRSYNDVGRIYHFDDGSDYYSVTTMLGATKDQTELNKWKDRVGDKKAKAISKVACDIGTNMHDCLEHHLLGHEYKFHNSVVKNLCKQITPYLDKKVSHVYGTEKFLYSDRLKLAGTVDGIVDYQFGSITQFSILDFKTAKGQPKIEWIQDYFIQLTIYAMMLAEMNGTTRANKGILLFAYKQKRSSYNEITIDISKYEQQAIERVELFHKKVGLL